MGYNATKKTLTTSDGSGIGLGDISKCIGNSSLDLGTLCRSVTINKWAKYKPVPHSKVGILTEAERLGDNQVQANGYKYGIYCGASNIRSLITQSNPEWFEYYMPTCSDGLWPYRILDFNGYDHYAKPNLYVSSYGSTQQKDGYVPVVINFAENNNSGLDYAGIVSGASTSSAGNTLGTWYPCMIISDSAHTWFYACYLMLEDAGTIQPLYNKTSKKWNPNYKSFTLNTIPEIANGSSSMSCEISFFLVSSLNELSGTASDGFCEVEENMGASVYAIPMGTQLELSIVPAPEEQLPKGRCSGYNSSYSNTTTDIYFDLESKPNWNVNVQYTITIDVGNIQYTDIASFTVSANTNPINTYQINWANYDLIGGENIVVTWYSATKLASGTTWTAQANGTIYITLPES